tara:strand:- start:361 stop:600 length:240 start_codon:yes stop_codon:yes gene_type:complete
MIKYSYHNDTDHMIVMRCMSKKDFFVERVVFPTETITIDAPIGADVELWGNGINFEERLVVGEDNMPDNYWKSYQNFDN